MKTYLPLAVLAGFIAGCSTAPVRSPQARLDAANTEIVNWYTLSQVSAMKLIEEYGPPDLIDSGRLTWKDKGPWKTTEVWDAEPNYHRNDPDILQQTVAYTVTPAQRKALEAFSDKVKINRSGTELSARYSSEALNILALNIADEVTQGARDPVDARNFFALTTELSASGKSSPYMQGLRFVNWQTP